MDLGGATPGPTPRSSAEPRLAAYGMAAAASLLAAVVLAEPGLLVVAVPFAVLAAIGVADRRPPVTSVSVDPGPCRVQEGDVVAGAARLHTVGIARHDVLVVAGAGLSGATGAADGGVHVDAPGAAMPPSSSIEVPFALRADRWGRHPLGAVHVRSRRRWSLLVWDLVVPIAAEVRVLPPATRVSRLLSPAEPSGLTGPHHSRARGHGSDVAELRPYRPGDRLRDVSWAATARTGTPWVAEHHPERTGTVVVLLDTMGEGSGPGSPGFNRVAGATWSLVSAHLRVGDRVGLLATGSTVRWLSPAAGRRARLLLLDTLLGVAGPRAPGTRGPGTRGPGTRTDDRRVRLPADALVVGVTMLQSDAFVAGLARHRRDGRTVVAVVVDPTEAAAPGAAEPPVEEVARRLWRAELEVRRAALARAGVPSTVVDGVGDVPAALRALRRRAARPVLRRAGAGAR